MTPDIESASRKLRQAEFFLALLEQHDADVVKGNPEVLLFLYSACLSAAKSVFYVLHKTGGPSFKKIDHDWRMSLRNDSERCRFNRMLSRRDDDVHYGRTGTAALQKWVEQEWRNRSPYHQYARPNVALFGNETTLIE